MVDGLEKSLSGGQKLESNRKPGEKRPYQIGEGKGKVLRYYNIGEVKQMRGLGYEVKPTLDLKKKIKSIDMIPNSEVVCELCEDFTLEELKLEGIDKRQTGTVRVGYDDGSFRMVCESESHKPQSTEKKKEETTNKPSRKRVEMTAYTKWINDN